MTATWFFAPVALSAAVLAACAPTQPAKTTGSATTESQTQSSAVTDARRNSATPAGAQSQANPQMRSVLAEMQALGAKPLHSLTVEQARSGPTPADAVKQVLKRQGRSVEPQAVARVVSGEIPGAAGPIPARIYWPQGAQPGGEALPVVLYIHGGGWVIADLDTYDATPRALANAAKAIVVSTHYRQAPEHPFPAAHEDTWAAYRWTLANAARMGGDPKRVAVAGESAGGNMAAAIALRARDERVQAPVHQLLVYPVVDAAVSSASEQRWSSAAPLATPDLTWFYAKYLRSPQDASHRYFSLRSADVAGVAPATVITAEIDPLRSEGEDYAERLRTAGVPVRLRNFDGVTHEFFGMGAVVDEARAAVEYGAAGLQSGWQAAGSATR